MKVGNQIEKSEKQKGIIEYEVNGEIVKLSPQIIRQYLVNGNGAITDQEINYFVALCKGRKLNPHLKEVHLIKYGSQPAQMVVGKDALLKRAILHKQYDGLEAGVWVVNASGEIEKRNGAIVRKEAETLLGGWCRVHRKDWKFPSEVDVNLDEYLGKKSDGTPNAQWSTKTITMIVKVAKAQALREAFVEELSGMYEAEELGIDTINSESEDARPRQFEEKNIREVEKIEELEKDEEFEF